MVHKDDRAEFSARAKEQAIALGRDKAVFKASTELVTQLDTYDYSYLWSWMGVPIIQMPADVMATQEVIWETKPDIIIETGVARGGSVLFMAGMLRLLGIGGKVIGVDIDIRAHNRDAIEAHPMSSDVILIEGGSVDQETLAEVRSHIPQGARVMVILDSDHSYDHVLAECRAYGPMVTPGCFMVVADTLVGLLEPDQVPQKRSKIWEKGNEPLAAMQAYLDETDLFEPDEALNGKLVLSSSPGGYLRRKG
ncbi:CmcI family methyltransferase [Parasphingorhabdus sp.]|jgi:cephalosporin hydroxylase|uniref:cephalosporin hydroxylase family protein n=1 Tax=Parasphingorhabdus sp. TaxID=2709688 RepID=UPI0032EC5BE9